MNTQNNQSQIQSTAAAKYWPPLTFDLTEPQVRKLESVRRARGLRSVSEVVRLAIAEFDFAKFEKKSPRFKQISVRLDPAHRERLRRCGKRKNVSIGELLREALEALPAKRS